jgi:hypothetical protein
MIEIYPVLLLYYFNFHDQKILLFFFSLKGCVGWDTERGGCDKKHFELNFV